MADVYIIFATAHESTIISKYSIKNNKYFDLEIICAILINKNKLEWCTQCNSISNLKKDRKHSNLCVYMLV